MTCCVFHFQSHSQKHRHYRFIVEVLKGVASEQTKKLDANFQRLVNKARFENYLVAYNAFRCHCKTEYDIFVNISLWKDILEQFCDRTHSQYGIVAILRTAMITVNKEIWKAFLELRSTFLRRESAKRKNKEL